MKKKLGYGFTTDFFGGEMNHGSEIASKISTSLRIYTIFFGAIVSRSSFCTNEAWYNSDHVAKNTRPFSDSPTLPQEAVEAML